MDSTCLNCEAPLQGPYCSSCGQKVIEPKERTVKYFLYQFLGSAFFLENNFVKNVWVLLTRPGLQALDFIEGRRKRWMQPFSLFLLINLFYFWYSPLPDMNLSLVDQMNQPYRALSQRMVASKLQREGLTLEQYDEVYNKKSTGYANSLIAFHLPVFALFLGLFYYRKDYCYVDHVVFANYVLAFVLLVSLFEMGLLAILLLGLKTPAQATWPIVTGVYFLIILYYLFASLKRVYRLRLWVAALSVVPVLIAFLISHFLYRLFLFLVIYAVT